MAKIHDSLKEVKTLSYKELLDKRILVCTERLKIESKLNEADENKAKGEVVDYTWYSKTEYAYKCTGILITAIDIELGFRKGKGRDTISDVFMQVARDTMPADLFESILDQARELYERGQSE